MDAIIYLNRKKNTTEQVEKMRNKNDEIVEQWKLGRIRELE